MEIRSPVCTAISNEPYAFHLHGLTISSLCCNSLSGRRAVHTADNLIGLRFPAKAFMMKVCPALWQKKELDYKATHFLSFCVAYQDCDSLPTFGFALAYDLVACIAMNDKVLHATSGYSAVVGLAGELTTGHVSAALSLPGNLKGATEDLQLWRYDWDKKSDDGNFTVPVSKTGANFRGAIKLNNEEDVKQVLGDKFPVSINGQAAMSVQVYDAYKDNWGFQLMGNGVVNLVISLEGKRAGKKDAYIKNRQKDIQKSLARDLKKRTEPTGASKPGPTYQEWSAQQTSAAGTAVKDHAKKEGVKFFKNMTLGKNANSITIVLGKAALLMNIGMHEELKDTKGGLIPQGFYLNVQQDPADTIGPLLDKLGLWVSSIVNWFGEKKWDKVKAFIIKSIPGTAIRASCTSKQFAMELKTVLFLMRFGLDWSQMNVKPREAETTVRALSALAVHPYAPANTTLHEYAASVLPHEEIWARNGVLRASFLALRDPGQVDSMVQAKQERMEIHARYVQHTQHGSVGALGVYELGDNLPSVMFEADLSDVLKAVSALVAHSAPTLALLLMKARPPHPHTSLTL